MDSATHPTFKFEIKSDTFESERERKSIFDDFETFLNENNVAPHGPVRNLSESSGSAPDIRVWQIIKHKEGMKIINRAFKSYI